LGRTVTILGGGPAGSAAGIAAQREGCSALIIEKSKFPRHKVCGEFFSPEIQPALEDLGVWQAFLAENPARIRRMRLHFGRREKSSRLPEPAWGLSRYAFDALLFNQVVQASACEADPTIIATGRRAIEPRGRRLFGFKAHFEGPVDDAVELFFFDRCYVGVTAIENGRTNVCGLGPEDVLSRFNFDFDRVVAQSPALAERIGPLRRLMKWISTGPLRFAQVLPLDRNMYPVGDALSFVDPFTGSGLVAAVTTGTLAGRAAARGVSIAEYSADCRRRLRKSFEVASIFRGAIRSGWAEHLAGLVPGRVLFALTRPGK
jgi:flavin-dependent dehydrogenase